MPTAGRIQRLVVMQPIRHQTVERLVGGFSALIVEVEDLTASGWLTARGYRVEHFDYSQVMTAWPTVEASIAEALRAHR
jgi:hypothetical protein